MNIFSSQQIPVADDFYLMALDERTAKIRLHGRALDLGLSAALLSELVLAGHLTVDNNRILLRPRRPPVYDPVHYKMVKQIVAEPDHPVNVWLSFFARTAADWVARRLVSTGYLRVETSRGLLRSKQIYTPIDRTHLAWRPVRLVHLISRRQIETWEDLALIGLLQATGLIEAVIATATQDIQADLLAVLPTVADDVSLHALASQVESLLAANVLRTT